jgi:predicted ATPase/class 3 adenylate cyclase
MSALFSFGEWLKQRRSALLLSREQLAQQVGCAEVTLRKIEADERRPSLAIAERLADLLEVQAAERALFLQVARGLASAERLPSPIPRGAAMPPPPISPSTPPALPSGTVTFLFTDIEASTQLWEQHQQAMPAALAHHDTLLRAGVVAHGGAVVKNTGDGVLAVFARATDAVHAALAIQRTLAEEQWNMFDALPSPNSHLPSPIALQVRMALHSGVTEVRDGDYFGAPLNRAARLLAAGHGGQVLLSLATTELVREHLPPDTELRNLGLHRLKDLSRPEQIFQLVVPDLPDAFPSLNTLNMRHTNLPAQPTALIGRDREVATVCAQLRRNANKGRGSEVRLVTLTGTGGTGKTRLGFQVAAELLDTFIDGVYFVNLAPISDLTLVASAIAQTLGVTESGDQPLVSRLYAYLRDKQLLLLLDNFEQIVDAAPLVAELLAECPKVKLLVTSRVPLHLRGEQEFAVPPLALPPADNRRPTLRHRSGQATDDQYGNVVSDRPSVITQYAAVQLFIQRALDVQPAFAVTNVNAPAVAEICARLDGLPLAIELAAARIKLFAPEALLARLNNRLALLTGGARDLPERQQTLRNAIAWSYDLLDEPTQMLFARLGVFVGGCTLEAAEAVCGDKEINRQGDEVTEQGHAFSLSPNLLVSLSVLDGLALLADNSLLKRKESTDGEPRFIMLETIREYALERLEFSDEGAIVQRRHAQYFLELAETADAQLQRAGQRLWLDRLEAEHDNLHAALAWALGGGDTALGGRLAVALSGIVQYAPGYWRARGYWSEGRQWLELALSKNSTVASTLRAMLLTRFANFVPPSFSLEQVMALHEAALALFRTAEDTSGIALTLMQQGTLLLYDRGDSLQATRLLEESLTYYRDLGERRGSAAALHFLGDCAREQGDLTRAATLLEDSVAILRESDPNESALANSLNGLGDVALLQGDIARATTLYWEAVRLLRNVEDRWSVLFPLGNLGWLALVQGDDGRVRALLEDYVDWFRYKHSEGLLELLHLLSALVSAEGDATRATALLREALALHQQLDRQDLIAEGLVGFAWMTSRQGQTARAARLLGATESMFVGGTAARRFACEHCVAAVRAQLDETTFAEAWAEGQALTLEQAIAEALGEDDQAAGVP